MGNGFWKESSLHAPDRPDAQGAVDGDGRYVEDQGLQDEVVAMVYPDRRGEGYGLGRFNDDKRMEYTRIKDEPDVHFAHNKGFIAKVTATEVARLKELVEKSWKK